MIESLLVAPLGVLVGFILSKIITDETAQYDVEFVWYFLLFASFSVFFSSFLAVTILSVLFCVTCLYFKRAWLLSLSLAALIWSVNLQGEILVLVSVAVACGYFMHHKMSSSLWVLALVPTLISALLLLL